MSVNENTFYKTLDGFTYIVRRNRDNTFVRCICKTSGKLLGTVSQTWDTEEEYTLYV